MVICLPPDKSIVLIGLMGAGKTSVGRRLGMQLGLPFIDVDEEVVIAAGCSIDDIFELYGEASFREVEKKVISRLLSNGRQVLATGGGAFMAPETRAMIRDKGISVWLRADIETLFKRTRRRGGRPLLETDDPYATLEKLISIRYPVYAESDIVIDSNDETPTTTTKRVAEAVDAFIKRKVGPRENP